QAWAATDDGPPFRCQKIEVYGTSGARGV
ncbi:MAG: hypothetical protein JWP07_2312, partial [Pseudonocardiales bacterium]|nr:hypothetical protein [Pseudonocardiales bacterium]